MQGALRDGDRSKCETLKFGEAKPIVVGVRELAVVEIREVEVGPEVQGGRWHMWLLRGRGAVVELKLMRGEDVRGGGRRIVARATKGAAERGGAPQGAPAAGEGLGAGTILGREEGDDAAKDIIGEAADQIGATATATWMQRLLAARFLRSLPLGLSAGGDAHGSSGLACNLSLIELC